jgi:hypothetical protein
VVTYAGFEGESELLLDLYKLGLRQPEIGTDLRAGDGLLMFWTHSPQAPWQDDAWLAQMRRSLRPESISEDDREQMGYCREYVDRLNFCIWQRVRSLCRSHRALQGRKPIRQSRCSSSSALPPAAGPTSSHA